MACILEMNSARVVIDGYHNESIFFCKPNDGAAGILTERYSLNPAWVEQVADATRLPCPLRCEFLYEKTFESAPFKVNRIQSELLM